MTPTADAALLLHGQPGSAHDWEPVRAAIGGRVRTIAVARPGWDGRSRPLDLAGNAAVALARLDAEGVEHATVVGHSLGGAIAAWLAAEHPERVRALVLAAPSASWASLNRLDELLARPILGTALTTGAFTGIGLSLAIGSVRGRLARRLGLDEGYLRRYAWVLLNPLTWRSFGVEQRMLVRELPSLEPRLRAICVPTTIVIGTADRIVTPSSARGLASEIPNAGLVQLAGASHLLLQERPAEMADLIVEATGAQDL
jgi:pimeloyl-ACP methyl ester carboxylesterase